MTHGALLIGALILSLLHSLIPTHWAPFVVVGTMRRWTRAKLAWVTFLSGFVHAFITMLLGIAAAGAGLAVQKIESFDLHLSGAIILIFTGVFLILARLFGGHFHRHFNPEKYASSTDAILILALVGMLSLSPCTEIIPLYILAASAGWKTVAMLSVILILGTSIGMTLIVVFFGDRISKWKFSFIEENAGLVAGILLIGLGALAFTDITESVIPAAGTAMSFGAKIVRSSWGLFRDAAVYILFGTLVGGIAYMFIPPERVARLLGHGKIMPVIRAALIGVPLPLCSCGVIPAALTLRKMGATRGATTAFLITTPETGVDSIAVTYGMLGPVFAVFRPVAALVTGVIAGLLDSFFGGAEDTAGHGAEHPPCDCECKAEETHDHPPAHPTPGRGFGHKIKSALTYSFGEFLGDISPWLLIGFLAAGLILVLVPAQAVERAFGSGVWGMIAILVVSIPMYICASATTPMAAALLLQGASPGAALVLLLAGPASNTAGIVMVAKFLGRRTVVIYLCSIAICSLGFGLLLNAVFDGLGISPAAVVESHRHAGNTFEFLKTAGAILLGALVLFHLSRLVIRHLRRRTHAHTGD